MEPRERLQQVLEDPQMKGVDDYPQGRSTPGAISPDPPTHSAAEMTTRGALQLSEVR